MASAFKAIGKFIFGGGGSGTQPSAPPAQPAPAQNPSGTPNTNSPPAQTYFLLSSISSSSLHLVH